MKLKEQILNDIKNAMKEKNDFKRDTLRTLNAAFKQIEIDERIELDDERIHKIIANEIKKRKDAITLYKQANREDLAQKEENEIEILKTYLPQQLNDNQLTKALEQLVKELGVKSLKEQGLVMKEAKAKLGASVDGKRLNEALRKILN